MLVHGCQMFWLRQTWACENCLSHSEKKTAQKEDSERGIYKIGYEEEQSDTNEDEEV